MHGAQYRVWQFGRLLFKRISPSELEQVKGWLTPSLFAVFCKMNPAEQYHAYCVRQTLVEAGCIDPDLLTAALLHDVGKSYMPLAVWEKVLVVLGGRFAPQTMKALGNKPDDVRWWSRAFVNAMQHPAWGGEMVAAGGGTPLAVELVRRHQEKVPPNDPLHPLLSALQSADNSN
jgi:hypothetical protein